MTRKQIKQVASALFHEGIEVDELSNEAKAELREAVEILLAALRRLLSREFQMTKDGPKIVNVYCFPNGMVAVTDQCGQQMPEYQGRYGEVWPKIEPALQPHSRVHRS